MSDQMEWEHCSSYQRIYTAFNETLSTGEFLDLLRAFFEQVEARAELCELLGAGDAYEAFVRLIVEDLRDSGEVWVIYARGVHPLAPPGFENFGRMANEPKRPPPQPPPRAYPLPHPGRGRR